MLTPSLATTSPCYCVQCQITAKAPARFLVSCSIVNANLERNPVSQSSAMPRSRASRRYDGGGRELSSKKRNDVVGKRVVPGKAAVLAAVGQRTISAALNYHHAFRSSKLGLAGG